VLEDDYDAEYRYDGAPVGTLQGLAPDRVVYLGTASKTLAPGLRLGWLASPERLVADVAAERWSIDSGGAALDQRAYAQLIEGGALDRHLRRCRAVYRRRRDTLASALEHRLPGCRIEGIAAGVHVTLRLARDTDEAAVIAAAARRGVRINGLASYRLTPAPGDPGLVVGYGRLPAPSIEPVADELADAIAEVG
jgi:GntR family transcriptional regulator/MocR family aminotransferase